jgi:glycolate oxidase
MVGSEGTLGIFTKVTLKLVPLPKATVDLLCLFETPEEAIAVVPRIMTAGGIIPTAVEFVDRACFEVACDYLNESLLRQEAGAMLIITFDGPNEEEVEREYETAGDLCYEAGAIEVYVADNYTTSERIWRMRRNIPEAWKWFSEHRTTEDIVVPIAAIPQVLEATAEISRKYDTPIPCYGHAGDGNLHAKVVKNPDWSYEKWHDTLPEILTDLYRATAELGGTISGEHGIGHKRKKFMPLVCSEAHLEMMRAVKRALDPNNILNPGKIVDV